MSAAGERSATVTGHRLPSILDGFPAGVPVTLEDLEIAMAADLERRSLAALDRALARLSPALLVCPRPQASDRIDQPNGTE